MKPQRFAVTPGEPAGIGPDLCLLLASQPQPHPLIAITSRDLLLERDAQLGVAVNLLDVAPGNYRFALGMAREFSGEPALIVEVGGTETRLDVGPGPGTAPLTVRMNPERGRALWVIAGDPGRVGNPPRELMRAKYAQFLYQPAGDVVTLQGLRPGRYTLVWANYHMEEPEGPVVRVVDMPSSAEVVLTQ